LIEFSQQIKRQWYDLLTRAERNTRQPQTSLHNLRKLDCVPGMTRGWVSINRH
jgi:hypothetical protein